MFFANEIHSIVTLKNSLNNTKANGNLIRLKYRSRSIVLNSDQTKITIMLVMKILKL